MRIVVLVRARARLVEFATARASPEPLAILRIGIAAALIVESAILAPYLHVYYGPLGLVQAPVSEVLAHWSFPSLSGIAHTFSFVGMSPSAALDIVFALYVFAIHLLLLGWHTRAAAVASWLLFLVLKKAGSASMYGAFELAHIALFYCAVLPVGHALSLDALRRPRPPSAAARLGLRIVQAHLCVVYLSSGLEKAVGEQWRNGEAIWRALMRPGHGSFDFSWLAAQPLLAKIACWATLTCEIGYAVFVWWPPTRRVWIAAAIGLHLAIAAVLGLIFFSAIMIVLNVAAFLIPAEPGETLIRASCGSEADESGRRHGDCSKAAPP